MQKSVRRLRKEYKLPTRALNLKVKEPRSLLFFKGSTYSCTFNKTGVFSQAQMALMYDLPLQRDIDNWQPIIFLLAPPGMKFIEYDVD